MKPQDVKSQDVAAALKKFGAEEVRKSLRKFRKELKLSQGELASLAGLAQNTLSQFERGKRNLSLDALTRLHNAITEALVQKEIALRKQKQKAARGFSQEQIDYLLGRNPSDHEQAHATREKVSERLIEAQQQHIRILKELLSAHEELTAEQNATIRDLERRIAELRDLLGLETQVAIVREKVQENG